MEVVGSHPLDLSDTRKWFSGRKLLVATKHAKENVMAEILENSLGVTCQAVEGLDTDLLGTFTGERPRLEDPLSAARKKCCLAMDMTGCDLVVASEGSFGPHPDYFFLPADDELLVLIDKKNGIEVVARELSTDTNFNAAVVSSEDELRRFAEACGFPSHGLILRKDPTDSSTIRKGMMDWEMLLHEFAVLLRKFNRVHVETDMRAHMNPKRMEVIRKATRRLAEKLASCCPSCCIPGFSVSEVVRGLPCESCDFPTGSPFAYLSKCQRCGHVLEKKYPHGKSTEDPMYCDRCNP